MDPADAGPAGVAPPRDRGALRRPFEQEWQRLEPRLAKSVAEAGQLLHTGGLEGFLDTLGPRVRGYPGKDIWYNLEAPWSIGMTYDAPFVTRQTRPRIPPADLVTVLRWIAERPRSTQELAPLVGVTESTLSKHLRQLTESGVLEPRRDGHYVLYHLRRDRLEPLAESLLAYLDAD